MRLVEAGVHAQERMQLLECTGVDVGMWGCGDAGTEADSGTEVDAVTGADVGMRVLKISGQKQPNRNKMSNPKLAKTCAKETKVGQRGAKSDNGGQRQREAKVWPKAARSCQKRP